MKPCCARYQIIEKDALGAECCAFYVDVVSCDSQTERPNLWNEHGTGIRSAAPEQISAMDSATMKDIMQTSGQPKLMATAPP